MTMLMMKKPVVLVTCILLISSLTVLAIENSAQPSECCFKFYNKALPKRKVVTFKYTDPRCTMRAVLLTMKKGGIFCVNPSEEWVKNITEAKDWVHTKTGDGSGFKESA